ncbi:MAG: Crp/Fnr family transcriptional regulator [Prevotellaceae bacterium]|nr:Crp/Fnr family transcriptional regulator [Prevotellaceae bacterium]
MAERLYTDADYILEKLPLFIAQIPLLELRAVCDAIEVYKFKKNDLIYVENTEVKDFMCLLEGKAKIYMKGVGGREQILRIVRSGDYFGYRPFFDGGKYVSRATACSDSIICFIPIAIMDELANSNLRIANIVIRSLAHELGTATERLVGLTQKHMRGRLADSLLMLAESFGKNENGVTILDIRLSRQDIADLSNMTLSNAIRTLSDFIDEKIIKIEKRIISILDAEKLKKISEIG